MLSLIDSMLKILNIMFELHDMEFQMMFRDKLDRIAGQPQSLFAFVAFAAAGDR